MTSGTEDIRNLWNHDVSWLLPIYIINTIKDTFHSINLELELTSKVNNLIEVERIKY